MYGIYLNIEQALLVLNKTHVHILYGYLKHEYIPLTFCKLN